MREMVERGDNEHPAGKPYQVMPGEFIDGTKWKVLFYYHSNSPICSCGSQSSKHIAFCGRVEGDGVKIALHRSDTGANDRPEVEPPANGRGSYGEIR